MPRRLRQCTDGLDLEGSLRGSDEREFWQGAGRLCFRQPSKTRAAERPSILRPHGRADHAEGDHMMRLRRLQTAGPGSVVAMKNWRHIALHAGAAATLIFLLQRYVLHASL